MEVAYQYSRPRFEFGRPCKFSHVPAQILESIPPTDEYDNCYRQRNPTTSEFDTTPLMSETEVNTERVVVNEASMSHTEGGWPKDVDITEQSDVQRFRKKAEKDESFHYAIRSLVPIVERCMKQNNTVDVYEHYFTKYSSDQYTDPVSAKGIGVFRDPSLIKRTATSINWHPEANSSKIAVSYSILNFQDKRLDDSDFPLSSYIWDVTNTNTPLVELLPPSPLTCLRFNPKSSETLVGGCFNGLITCFDLRKPNASSGRCRSLESSIIEKSHHDPVSDVFWVSSKTGHQCVSVSTDGKLMWWDTRKLNEPIDSLVLTADGKGDLIFGGSSLEYSTEAGPTKYLVGSEQGVVISINLRNRKINNGVAVYDSGPGKHHGAIYAIHRNPIHNKFFLTVGDWTARVWSEDLKTPIVTTKYHDSYLTSGCWSPSRPSVFFVTRADGVLDVWDFYHGQNNVAYSHKIGNSVLSSIGIQENGKFVAVGDVNGATHLLEVCDSLASQRPNEKSTINAIFERETKREKNLEIREKEIKRAKTIDEERVKQDAVEKLSESSEKMNVTLNQIEEDFKRLAEEKTDYENDSLLDIMSYTISN